MKKIKVDVSDLGRKEPVILPVDVKNVKRALAFQGELYDTSQEVSRLLKSGQEQDSDEAMLKFLQAQNEQMSVQLDTTLKYLAEILELTDEEVDKMEEMSTDDIYKISNQVTGSLINPDDEEVEGGTPREPQQSISEH